MNYEIDQTNPLIAYIKANSLIDTLFVELPNVTTFIFESGNFYLNKELVISKNNIRFTSQTQNNENVHIFQNNPNQNSLVILRCTNIIISHISVHNTHPGKIALTVASGNRININNCYFYGNTTTFTIYFAGPSHFIEGHDTLNRYFLNELDNRNSFIDNVVYTEWSGDSISFSLQKNATFARNIIRGGKVAIYMCNDTKVVRNIMYDSTTNGLFISLPCKNLDTANNKIYECAASGIKISNQNEHGPFESFDYFINVENNIIYDAKFYAVEINYGRMITLSTNKFVSTDIFGIYCYLSQNINISKNSISYFQVAVWLENSRVIYISENKLYSVFPKKAYNIIKAVNNSNNITYYHNTCKGDILYDRYSYDATSSIDVQYNTDSLYYSKAEETLIMKL